MIRWTVVVSWPSPCTPPEEKRSCEEVKYLELIPKNGKNQRDCKIRNYYETLLRYSLGLVLNVFFRLHCHKSESRLLVGLKLIAKSTTLYDSCEKEEGWKSLIGD